MLIDMSIYTAAFSNAANNNLIVAASVQCCPDVYINSIHHIAAV